jgi:alkanesulfonate monooxygenase SsuD/methylene tetrahydromethanopterin reductase-like flavin-dependent oxidoreductase (luciferase family)
MSSERPLRISVGWAIAAVPDEYLDEGALVGGPERIRERFGRWRDAGFTTLRFVNPADDAMELVARLAAA